MTVREVIFTVKRSSLTLMEVRFTVKRASRWRMDAAENKKRKPLRGFRLRVDREVRRYSLGPVEREPFTTSLRPMKGWSCSVSTARLASSIVIIVTKPKPFDL